MEIDGEERSSMDTEGDDEHDRFVAGEMEIDDAEDMAEVADILLHLNVTPLPPISFSLILQAKLLSAGWAMPVTHLKERENHSMTLDQAKSSSSHKILSHSAQLP